MTDRFLSALATAHGEARALTAVQLCQRLGLPTTESGKRIVRACAREAVLMGVLVCSGQPGYWLPATAAEARHPIARLKAEAASLLRRSRALEGLLESRFGVPDGHQGSLWEGEA